MDLNIILQCVFPYFQWIHSTSIQWMHGGFLFFPCISRAFSRHLLDPRFLFFRCIFPCIFGSTGLTYGSPFPHAFHMLFLCTFPCFNLLWFPQFTCIFPYNSHAPIPIFFHGWEKDIFGEACKWGRYVLKKKRWVSLTKLHPFPEKIHVQFTCLYHGKRT